MIYLENLQGIYNMVTHPLMCMQNDNISLHDMIRSI